MALQAGHCLSSARLWMTPPQAAQRHSLVGLLFGVSARTAAGS